MVAAPDALVLDTSEMSIAQAIAAALAALEGKLSLTANGLD
jgi:cytidylate kinase